MSKLEWLKSALRGLVHGKLKTPPIGSPPEVWRKWDAESKQYWDDSDNSLTLILFTFFLIILGLAAYGLFSILFSLAF